MVREASTHQLEPRTPTSREVPRAWPRWRRVVEARLDVLRAVLPEAWRGMPDPVHDARVASRRVRETLALLAASQHDVRTGKLMRRVRRVTRLLGRVRELDVEIQLLDRLAAAHPELSGEVQAAKGSLAETRRKQAARLARLSRGFAARLERRLDRLSQRLKPVAEIGWQQAIAVQIARRRRRLARALTASGTRYVPRQLHRVRIALKRLRYSVELASELSGRPARRPLASFKRVQELLGGMHDWQVLQAHLRDLDEGSRFGRTLALAELETRRLHARYLRRRGELRRAAAVVQNTFRRP